MDTRSFFVNLLLYIFSLLVSYLLISTFRFFPIILGAILCFGSLIGIIIIIINKFKNN